MKRKNIFFGIGLVLLCLAALAIYSVYKPHGNVGSEEPAATMTATNLYSEFQNTEDQANKKWVGKVIEIKGVISSVNETDSYVSINLQATTDGGINCSISKKDLNPDDKFNKGDSIIVKGKCTGFLMDVNMVDCVIKK